MSNTESSCCSVGHEINTDQLDGQNPCHLHAAEQKKMDMVGCKGRYHEQRHVHFQEAHASESELEKDEEEGKKLDTTDSDESYTIDLPRRRPHMAYLKMERNMNITIESVKKIINS